MNYRVVRIVVVDNNPEKMDVAVRMLEATYKTEDCVVTFDVVATATTAQEGLMLIRDLKPDMVISDGVMPIIDGYEMVALMGTHPETQGIPSLIITGDDHWENRDKALAAGASELLVLPLTISSLMQAIGVALKLPKRIA
jgi:CheY-like chemotaxis protein